MKPFDVLIEHGADPALIAPKLRTVPGVVGAAAPMDWHSGRDSIVEAFPAIDGAAGGIQTVIDRVHHTLKGTSATLGDNVESFWAFGFAALGAFATSCHWLRPLRSRTAPSLRYQTNLARGLSVRPCLPWLHPVDWVAWAVEPGQRAKVGAVGVDQVPRGERLVALEWANTISRLRSQATAPSAPSQSVSRYVPLPSLLITYRSGLENWPQL